MSTKSFFFMIWFIVSVFVCSLLRAEIILVPEDFETIQEGVSNSEAGDTVLVRPGTYTENIFIDMWEITLASYYFMTGDESFIAQTFIDGDSAGTAINLSWCNRTNRDQEDHVRIIGFTIQNGYGRWGGGGFVGWGAWFDIDHCVVKGNSADVGGAIYLGHGNTVTLTNSVFAGNSATNGGVIYNEEGNWITILHCTFYGNSATETGDAIVCNVSQPVIVNSIFWDDSENEIEGENCTIRFSNIRGGWEGEGNLNENPLLLDPDSDDYRLTEDSPCINAGTTLFIIGEDTLLNLSEDDYYGEAPDMGAFEFNPEDPDTVNSPEFTHADSPSDFKLISIFPNPFNSTTTIGYSLPKASPISLQVFDVNGRLVATLVDGVMPAGRHSVVWDAGEEIGAGFYFVRLKDEGGGMGGMRKVVLLK